MTDNNIDLEENRPALSKAFSGTVVGAGLSAAAGSAGRVLKEPEISSPPKAPSP